MTSRISGVSGTMCGLPLLECSGRLTGLRHGELAQIERARDLLPDRPVVVTQGQASV
jgi:hypothetical protein